MRRVSELSQVDWLALSLARVGLQTKENQQGNETVLADLEREGRGEVIINITNIYTLKSHHFSDKVCCFVTEY